jgi:hypothetical protein
VNSTYNLGQIINNIFVQDNRQRPYGGRNKRTDCKRPAYVEFTPTGALLFITILIKMNSNKNANGLPAKAAGIKSSQNLENVSSSVAIGRDANGSEIHITCHSMDKFIMDKFMQVTEKYQEQTDRMLAIIEKLINKQ